MTRRLSWLLPVLAASAVEAQLLAPEEGLRALLGPPPADAGPPMTLLRHDEDHRLFADPSMRTGAWWEPWKHAVLDGEGEAVASVGLELRLRYEGYRDELWGQTSTPDRDSLWTRALPHLQLRFGERLRVFSQWILAYETGDDAGRSPVDEDRGDFLQAFADWRLRGTHGDGGVGFDLMLRAGRQVMSYGSSRLIGTRYGPNVLQCFDTAQARLWFDAWQLDLLYGRPVQPRAGAFDDRRDDDEELWLAYATGPWGSAPGNVLDVYYIGHTDENAVYEEGVGTEERHTLGLRFAGAAGSLDWNHELFWQFGRFGSGAIRAWSVGTETGLRLADDGWRPRLVLRANVISGDDDAGDGDLETFNPLYPKGKYFGEIGLIGPYNLINVHPRLELEPGPGWGVDAGVNVHWRESTADAVYDTPGFVIRAPGGSDARFIGTQADLAVARVFGRHLDATAVYSLFFPGRFLEQTGPSETVHFVGLELRWRF